MQTLTVVDDDDTQLLTKTKALAGAITLWERRFMPKQPDDSPFILPSEQPQTTDTTP